MREWERRSWNGHGERGLEAPSQVWLLMTKPQRGCLAVHVWPPDLSSRDSTVSLTSLLGVGREQMYSLLHSFYRIHPTPLLSWNTHCAKCLDIALCPIRKEGGKWACAYSRVGWEREGLTQGTAEAHGGDADSSGRSSRTYWRSWPPLGMCRVISRNLTGEKWKEKAIRKKQTCAEQSDSKSGWAFQSRASVGSDVKRPGAWEGRRAMVCFLPISWKQAVQLAQIE